MRFIGFTLVLTLALTAQAAEKRLRVVTSFFPLYCWTANVAGDRADVENLLSGRAEPHEYAFTPADARKLSNADLVVINGLGLESWFPKFQRSSSFQSNRLVVVTAGLKSELLYGVHHHTHDHEHDHAGHEHEAANEHTWLDPLLAAHGVSNILVALQRADPANAAAYASNAAAYVVRLKELDGLIRQSLVGVTNRAIVTYHDAFAYFARRYALEVVGVVEQVPQVNPTPRALAQLHRTTRERKVRALFIPPGGENRMARRLSKDLGLELAELDTLETGPLSPAAYEEQMKFNARSLAKHLR